MKERPILFSGDMVRALLDGRKTQTRRVMKVQPSSDQHQLLHVMDSTERKWIGKSHWAVLNADKTSVLESDRVYFSCPYGQPGDRLWVRETWSHTGRGVWRVCDAGMALDGNLIYRASNNAAGVGWFPSIHMPRWASRILLEVTDVRVERLNGISEADARAEGIPAPGPENPWDIAINDFRSIWESINGAEAWASNPWVWVVEFRVIQPSEVAA